MEHHHAMGKSTNSMEMFNSFVKLLEGNNSVMYQMPGLQLRSWESAMTNKGFTSDLRLRWDIVDDSG